MAGTTPMEDDVTHQLSRLIAGNTGLTQNPALANSMLQSGATVPDAQTVNQFILGMQVSGRVQLAQQTGTTITLSDQERRAALALGVDPSGVTPPTVADYQNAVDSKLNPPKGPDKWSFGRVWHDITHNPITDAFGKTYNYISAAASENQKIDNLALTGNDQTGDNDQIMRDLGYDPNSFWSRQAFQASGHYKITVADLNDQYGQDAVDEAVKYLGNQKKYLDAIFATPGITPEEVKAKLDYLNSDQFKELATRLQARDASFGNMIALGIDPVAHPALHASVAVPVDIAANFLLDPTMAVTGALKTIRATQIVADSMGDFNKVADVVTGVRGGWYASQVRRGVNYLMKQTDIIRTGDDAEKAAAYARIRNAVPGLEHLVPDFLGEHQISNLAADATPVFGKGAPITTEAEAAFYLGSHAGMIRLFAGRPAAEIGLLPGQLSVFGVKQLKASLAGKLAARGINVGDAKIAARIPAAADDSVDAATGRVIAVDASGRSVITTREALASARRAGQNDVSYGQALFESRQGIFGTAQRSRLLAQRWFSYLPRNTVFDTNDPNSVKQVFQYANMYLTRSHANLLAARYAAGDEGVRKAIITGMQLQTLHAAGLGTTEAGRDLIDKAARSLSGEKYGVTSGTIVDPATGLEREVALWPGQVNEKLTLPNFGQLQTVAAKIGLWENTMGRMFNNKVVDSTLKLIRLGWQSTFSNVVRNAGEDLFGAYLRGEYGDVMRAKATAYAAGLLPNRSRLANLAFMPLGRVGQMYRWGAVNTADASLGLDYIARLPREELLKISDDYITAHLKNLTDPTGVADGNRAARIGMVARPMSFSRTGFGAFSTEGAIGADRLATHMATAFNGNPGLIQKIMDHIESPMGTPIEDVMTELEADPRLAKMTRANIYRDPAVGDRYPVGRVEEQAALRQLAEKQVAEFKYLVTGQNGLINPKLTKYLRNARKAPSTDWIMQNLAHDQRPASALAPMYEEVPTTPGITGMVSALSDLGGQIYENMVGRPIARISSMPVFLGNYGKMRAFMKPWEEDLVKRGLDPSAADTVAQNVGMDMAYSRTVKYIDDPTLRTQADVIARNFFAYNRATTAFIRRWASQLYEDPGRYRKALLTLEAGQRTGLVYTDPNGQQQFMFPGSGPAIEAMSQVSRWFPGMNFVNIPGLSTGFSGKVAYLSPGLQNPMQFSLTPMVNIPMRAIASFFPQHRQAFDYIDGLLNGSQGQGQSAMAELEPSVVKKFVDAFNSNDRDSMLADGVRSATLALDAAGSIPPPNATAADRQKYLTNLRTQVKNQLFWRAVFGFFTPAPPGTPIESTDASKADYAFAQAGFSSLDDEFKQIINAEGGDIGKAATVWATLHPDKMAYTVSTSTAGEKGATVQATQASADWIAQHTQFMKDYSGVAAYLIPQDVQGGQFDLNAYHAELEIGIRQHKSTAEFFDQVSAANSARTYYASIAARDAAIAADPTNAAEYKRQFTVWKATEFDPMNPVFADQQKDGAQAAGVAHDQVAQLRDMVQNGNVPKGIDLGQINDMVSAYDTYHSLMLNYPTQSNQDQTVKSLLSAQYNQWWQDKLRAHPEFGALYAGVFRTLDNNVLDPQGG